MRYPVNWEIVKLSDICDIKIGKTPARKTPGFWKDGIYPWLSISDMNQGRMISNTKEKITEYAAKKTKINLVPQNTLLLSFKLSIGKVGITAIPMFTNEAIAALTNISKKATTEYLYWVLKSINLEEGIDRAAKGKTLNKKKLAEIEIPLPPLSEQKRIAAILDNAEAIRDKRKKSIAKLDELLQSVFLDMFGDPVTNPKEWEKRPLSEICDIVAPMVDPRKEEYLNLLHYGPDRISKDTGELLHAKTAREDNLISGKFLCNHGEILYSKIRPYLNKVALVKERCLCSADVYPINPNIEQTTREFIFFLLRSRGFLDYVAGFSRRANIPKVNREQLFGYEAILPPISLQNEFSKKYFKISSSIDKAKDSFDLNNNLFSSLQQRAFRGEL